MAKLSDVQIAALIVEVWGKPWTSTIADGVGIVLAESGGNPAAINRANTNGTSDHGLWQINTVHAKKYRLVPSGHMSGSLWDNRYDPLSNTKMAYQIYRGWGRSWRPWSAYNNESYKKFRDRALKAAIAVQGPDKKTVVDSIIDQLKKGNPGLGIPGIPDIESPFKDVTNFLSFISDRENWIRLGFILAGTVLILFALYQIAMSTNTGKAFKKTVGAAAKVAITKNPKAALT